MASMAKEGMAVYGIVLHCHSHTLNTQLMGIIGRPNRHRTVNLLTGDGDLTRLNLTNYQVFKNVFIDHFLTGITSSSQIKF